jgi:hypothetical protein
MPSKKHKPEEIIGKLREAEIVLAHLSQRADLLSVAQGIWWSEDRPGA